MMKRTWVVMFALFITNISIIYADENQEIAANVCRQAYTAISRIEEGKIFLKSNKLHFYQGKIYVEDINGRGIAIPAVFSNERGLYLEADGFNIFNMWYCRTCKSWNHNVDNPTHCWRCGAPR